MSAAFEIFHKIEPADAPGVKNWWEIVVYVQDSHALSDHRRLQDFVLWRWISQVVSV